MRKEWKEYTGAEISNLITKGASPRWQGFEYQESGCVFITSENVRDGYLDTSEPKFLPIQFHQKQKNSQLRKDDVLINIVGASIGRVCLYDGRFKDANVNQAVCIFRANEIVLPDFLLYYFQAPHMQAHLFDSKSDSARPNLSLGDFNNFTFFIPPLPIQRKIVAILHTWDEAIEKQEKIIRKGRKRQKAIELNLYERLIRNKRNLCEAENLFEAVTEKKRSDLPLLAVTQDQGIVPRNKLDRRVVMPEGSVDGYKVVREGDFVISLRSFEGGFEYSGYVGLISPAYTILRPKCEIDPVFFRFYFKSYSFVGRLSPLVFGIRDGKSIAFRDFGFMEIPCPPIQEQKKISFVLLSSEEEIIVQNKRLRALKAQKRGLMQKLLTGTWPVKTSEQEVEQC